MNANQARTATDLILSISKRVVLLETTKNIPKVFNTQEDFNIYRDRELMRDQLEKDKLDLQSLLTTES